MTDKGKQLTKVNKREEDKILTFVPNGCTKLVGRTSGDKPVVECPSCFKHWVVFNAHSILFCSCSRCLKNIPFSKEDIMDKLIQAEGSYEVPN